MKLNYTHTLYASYTGYVTQAIINIFPPLIFIIFQRDFNISLTHIGLLASFNFAVQMLIDFLAIKFIDKIGYRIPMSCSSCLFCFWAYFAWNTSFLYGALYSYINMLFY